MKNKNILLISHFSNLSGAPISLALLAKCLRNRGYNPVFSIPAKGQLEDLLKQLGIAYEITGTIFSLYYLRKIIQKYNIQVVHANTIIAAPGAILAWVMNKKLVWHIREDISQNKVMIKIIERISDRIIILSQSMKVYFKEEIIADKLKIIHNGVDFSLFKTLSEDDKSQLRQELSIGKDEKIVTVIGTVEKRKGQFYFIEAIKLLKEINNVTYLIVGNSLPGQARYKKRLEKECFINNLSNVRFLPARADIPKLLQITDIVCVPSLAEPFGRVVVEGMAAGKPVIGSNVGGIPEIIDNQKTGILINPADGISLAKAISYLLGNSDICDHMGKSGFTRAHEFFSIEAHAEKIAMIYEEL